MAILNSLSLIIGVVALTFIIQLAFTDKKRIRLIRTVCAIVILFILLQNVINSALSY